MSSGLDFEVNESTIQSFQEDGVVLLRDALDAAELDAAFSAWQWSIDHPGPAATGLVPGTDHAFQDLCNPGAAAVYEPVLRQVRLASIAQQLWGGSSVWFLYEQVFHKRAKNVPRTPWHQDTSYWSINGAHLIAFWISFESIPIRSRWSLCEAPIAGPYTTHRDLILSTQPCPFLKLRRVVPEIFAATAGYRSSPASS